MKIKTKNYIKVSVNIPLKLNSRLKLISDQLGIPKQKVILSIIEYFEIYLHPLQLEDFLTYSFNYVKEMTKSEHEHFINKLKNKIK